MTAGFIGFGYFLHAACATVSHGWLHAKERETTTKLKSWINYVRKRLYFGLKSWNGPNKRESLLENKLNEIESNDDWNIYELSDVHTALEIASYILLNCLWNNVRWTCNIDRIDNNYIMHCARAVYISFIIFSCCFPHATRKNGIYQHGWHVLQSSKYYLLRTLKQLEMIAFI